MNGTILILLGGRDVILEATRDNRPSRVHDTERLVTLGERLHHDAESENVGELLEAYRFVLHLAPDRIGTLAAPGNLRGDAAFGELSRELLLDVRHKANVFRFERVEAPADHGIGFGIELAER